MNSREILYEFKKSIRKVTCNDRKRAGCVTGDMVRDYSLGDPIINEVHRVFSGRRIGDVILRKRMTA